MHSFSFKFIIILTTLITFIGCGQNSSIDGYLSIDKEHFVDSKGRTVILNGINYVTKDPGQYFKNDNDEEIFRQFRDWGFNCVRFGMSWRGIEPEPGKINEAYLKEIDKRVKLAEENGIWLILDMHQDLYGGKYGNGAPEWATIDDGLPHDSGDVWSDAYLVSPAIHRVFDNFWKNAPAPDGIGIQDHYIFIWKTLAKRYANSAAVAGFDIMNEPFTGAESIGILNKLLGSYGEIVTEQTGATVELNDILDMWGDEQSRTEALKTFDNKEYYRRITESAYEEVRSFEQSALSQFYQRVRDAVREVNKHHIIFLEHCYFSNLGVKSSFFVPTDKQGNPDPLIAYAPHGYDLVTDTDAADSPGYQRVEHIFEQIFEAGKEKQIPIVVGEWGAFYMGRDYQKPAEHLIGIFEQAQVGQTYWAYWGNIDTQDYFPTLSRHYPMRVNGKLLHYGNHFGKNLFECEWQEEKDSKIPTRIFIPDLEKVKEQIEIHPVSDITFHPLEGSSAGYIDIEATGSQRKLLITY